MKNNFLSNNKQEIPANTGLEAINLLESPRAGCVLIRWIIGIGLGLLVMLFLPWQQNIQATGAVTALSPENPPQTIQSAMPGQIARWYVQEGEFVKTGDIRNQQYFMLAPQDGFVVRVLFIGIGETINQGEGVVTILPENEDKAVELYVRPMDVPLLTVGSKIRLEFDGWPALQFTGWPSVAVGTFGGVIRVIDYVETESQSGRYRILVTPDAESDGNWPDQLRLGSGVQGFALLEEVPIWYELWRLYNGLPPSLQESPEATSSDYP